MRRRGNSSVRIAQKEAQYPEYCHPCNQATCNKRITAIIDGKVAVFSVVGEIVSGQGVVQSRIGPYETGRRSSHQMRNEPFT